MTEIPSPTDSELLTDSTIDVTQITDSNRARQFYNTTFISSSLNSEMEEGFSDQISQFQRAYSQQYIWTDDEIICLANMKSTMQKCPKQSLRPK